MIHFLISICLVAIVLFWIVSLSGWITEIPTFSKEILLFLVFTTIVIYYFLQRLSKGSPQKFTQFYSQLVNLQNLLGNHIAASKAFPILERITSHKVYYRSVDLKIPERQLELDGIAESYEVLGEQLESFNQAAEMENSLVNQSQLVNQAVQFKATLLLKDNVLK